MFATDEFAPRISPRKDTLIPLVLALAIAVAGIVEPNKSPLSLSSLIADISPQLHQRNSK